MPTATTWIDPHDLYPKVKAGELTPISQTVLNTADICLRRAAYYLDPDIPRGTSESAVCGTGYHAGLETYYVWRRGIEVFFGDDLEANIGVGDGPPTIHWPAPTPEVLEQAYEAVKGAVFAEVEHRDDFPWETSFGDTVARAQQMVHAYFAGGHYWPADYRIEGVEVGFTIESKREGWVDKGVIDLVVRHKTTGQLLLDDHKTSRRPWKKGKEAVRNTLQSPFYVDAWERTVGERPDGFSFSVMTYDGAFERRLVMVGDEDIEYLDRKKETIVPLLELVSHGLELPGNTQHFLCSEKWCDYWSICPFGAGTN